MRTRELLKYLVVMIMALNTSFNAMAQKNLKIFFKTAVQDVANNSTPRFQLGGDVPAPALGLVVKPEGVRWANGYRLFSGWHGTPTDRLIAAYVDENTKMDSKLRMEFENFPFEVNAIQWNAMNDLLSGAVFDITEWDTDIFDNYTVNYKYTPNTGNAITGSEQHWDLNIFTKRTDFNQGDMPGASNMAMNGLTSFEFNEENYFKVTIPIPFIGGWTLVSRKTALNDNCRTFIKAGWENGMVTIPADNWAFNIKYSLPELGLRFADGRTNNTLIVDENNGNGVSLLAYISAHAGAIEPGKLLTNYNKFYYEYVSSDPEALTIDRLTGTVYPKKVGAVKVTVYLRYGKGNEGETEISHTEKTLQINESVINESSPKICIGFVDGKKGYDVTVGDQNAQIQGFITANTPTDYSTGGYQFEYYESSNGEIITIDPTTGKITPKKEGDVNITAVLKKGSRIVSNPYTYTLHVFAQHEGLEFRRINTYQYSDNGNTNYTGWKVTATNNQSYEWKPNNLLRVNSSINGVGNTYGVNDWKQIASFSTGEFSYWRAICQEIAFDVYVPKYTKSVTQYSFAGNAAIGSKKTHSTGRYSNSTGDCKYGFEINYLNQKWVNGKPVNEQITLEEANEKLIDRMWDTNAGSVTETFARRGASSYTSNVGIANALNREINNVDASNSYEHKSYTVYFAAMAYLWNNESYPGDVSIGFKGIPTYTYHAKVTYAKNDGTNAIVHTQSDWKTSTSKTETFKLFQGANNSEKAQLSSRAGYTFLGWSTDPNATTPEYELEDDFPIYDNVNGGGMGPVTLYAVWKPNNYIVTLHKNDGGEDETAQIEVTYEQPMPENIGLVAPTRKGYDFRGYHNAPSGGGTFYYDSDMKSAHIYDKVGDSDLYARWTIHKTEVSFDANGGVFYNNVPTVTATYNQQMPTIGVYEGNENTPIPAPSRTGYTFAGYYYPGNGTTYYNYSNGTISSARKWNIDERTLDPQVEYVTLYAKWIPDTYAVTLDPQGGEGGSTSVTATFGQPLPSGLTAPTKPGYEFKGYYSNENQEYAESQGQDYGGTRYYDKDMVGVENWDKTYNNVTIYAHWAPATYKVYLYANGGVLPKSVVESNKENFDIAISKVTNDTIIITYKYKAGKSKTLVAAEAKRPGYELLGWFDSNGVKVIEANEKSRNCTITDNGGYWAEDSLTYNHIGDITLTAEYRKKYKYADNIITFGKDDNGNPEKVEPDEDWLYSVVNDLVGAAKDVYDNEPGNPQTMVFDLTESVNRWTGGEYNCQHVMEDLQAAMQNPEYSACISPNVLVYFNEKSYYADKCNNAILSDLTCPNLYVTDRYQMKILYEFKAGKALYERNKLQKDNNDLDDGMWKQSNESLWGTLCLPYPIRNNNTHYIKDENGNNTGFDCKVIFYELRRKSGNVMQFYKLPEDAVIPANTPVMYERRVGVSSAVIIEEVSEDGITVPKNMNYAAETKTYDKAILNTEYDWQFIGNMEETTFYGKNCKSRPAGVIGETKDVIYYFKKDNFTRMGDANYMILYPYRAYFREVGAANSDSKVASYSILVIDDEGATDITNAIFGDGEGDGKIYDLNGVRVKQPVRGRLYIVNGKKKVYE